MPTPKISQVQYFSITQHPLSEVGGSSSQMTGCDGTIDYRPPNSTEVISVPIFGNCNQTTSISERWSDNPFCPL